MTSPTLEAPPEVHDAPAPDGPEHMLAILCAAADLIGPADEPWHLGAIVEARACGLAIEWKRYHDGDEFVRIETATVRQIGVAR